MVEGTLETIFLCISKLISIPQLITCRQEGKMHRGTTTACSIQWGTAAVAGAYLVICRHPILHMAAGICRGGNNALPHLCREDRRGGVTPNLFYVVFRPFCFCLVISLLILLLSMKKSEKTP